MKREILFRGKIIDTNEWVEGYYFGVTCDTPFSKVRKSSQIILKDCNLAEVIPETVGQYTGLTDENDKRIFEDDIVAIPNDDELCIIKWDEDMARFVINGREIACDFDNYWGYELEVVGNIYDNPELIGDNEKP